jgi:hypothetical protein
MKPDEGDESEDTMTGGEDDNDDKASDEEIQEVR